MLSLHWSRHLLAAGCTCVLGLVAISDAHALTIVNGNNLVIDGPGTLGNSDVSLADIAGDPVDMRLTNAVLKGGFIYYQVGGGGPGIALLGFNGTTRLQGGSSYQVPLDVLLLRGAEGGFIEMTNRGTLIQSGDGAFNQVAGANFHNATSSTFEIQNDKGFGEGTALGGGTFYNEHATLWKTGGTGTSVIAQRVEQVGGKVESWTGQLLLNGGGSHVDSRFFADTFGTNAAPVGIAFGGTHSFSGTTITETGTLALTGGARLDVAGVWNQRAQFNVDGSVHVAAGGVLNQTGTLLVVGLLSNDGTIVNQGTATARGELHNDALFDNRGGTLRVVTGGHITTGLANDPWTSTGTITNSGTIVIEQGASIRTTQMTQTAGLLTVDGLLDNYNGRLAILGGRLDGGTLDPVSGQTVGRINGDVYVGCPANVAGCTAMFTPGHSPATFTIDGGLTMDAGSELVLDLVRLGDGTLAWDTVWARSFYLDGIVRFHIGADITDADLSDRQLFLRLLDDGSGGSFTFGADLQVIVDGHDLATFEIDGLGIHLLSLGDEPPPPPPPPPPPDPGQVPEPASWTLLAVALLAWRVAGGGSAGGCSGRLAGLCDPSSLTPER